MRPRERQDCGQNDLFAGGTWKSPVIPPTAKQVSIGTRIKAGQIARRIKSVPTQPEAQKHPTSRKTSAA